MEGSLDLKARTRILWAAERWVGVPYNEHHRDRSWAVGSSTPRAFDGVNFVCRVAMDALGYPSTRLLNDAAWLLDHLMVVTSPEPGDIVCYVRTGLADDVALGDDLLWHVMIYYGAGKVIGACDVAKRVCVRDLEYGVQEGDKRWHLAWPPYRALRLRVS